MSKTIDSLDRLVRSRNNMHPSIHEDIARTYLRTSNQKIKGQGKKNTPKSKMIYWLTALLLSMAAFLLSRAPTIDKDIFFVKGSEPNKDMISNASFLGDAHVYSRVRDDMLVLCNSKGYGWANYTIELKRPVDLNSLHMRYTGKGIKGGEHLVFTVIDANSRSYRMERDPSSVLAKDWQEYDIGFKPLKNLIDLKKVSIIRLEFGSLTAGNDPTATIFLKDIYITKSEKGLKDGYKE